MNSSNRIGFFVVTLVSSVVSLSAMAAEILVLVDPAHKADLISDGIISDSVFSHPNPNIIVVDSKTELNIGYFQAEGKIEISKMCYVGTSDEAASILEKLVQNVETQSSATAEFLLTAVSTVSAKPSVSVSYNYLNVEDVVTKYQFEVEACPAPPVDVTKGLDPIANKYKMCSESVIQLPDSVFDGISTVQKMSVSEDEKMSAMKDVFASVAADQSKQSFCNVMVQVAGKKPTKVQDCQEALSSEDLITEDLLEMNTQVSESHKKAILCSFSSAINFMTFGF